uniref:Uncharacterized protein n=1 Tax=viral metagenome TaxID=1070528 RepID=A0A6C0IGY6_9ZZZZ
MSNGYYRPYKSGDEDDDESGNESDTTHASDTSYETDQSETAVAQRRAQDPRYAILKAAGPNLNTSEKQLEYLASAPLWYSPWDESTNIDSLKDHVYLVPPKSTKTSLVSIKSSNRDKRLYPSPFNFQLKLPRTYTNITKFQLVQMSFPNSSGGVAQYDIYASTLVDLLITSGVPSTCISTCISVMNCTTANTGFGLMEQGRTIDTSNATIPLMTTLSVPDINLNNHQLAQELTFQANNTPPFNVIDYDTFRDIFTNTRDISVLFNEPGDNFQSKTNGIRYSNPTKEQIMNTYYTQQHIDSFPVITEDIAFNAYYFPILKEAIATKLAKPFIQTDSLSFDDVVTAVMGPFQGLNSPLYSMLCHLNQGALDGYRPNLTFQLNNINSYKWSYNEKESRFTTLHNTLHTSIQRDRSKHYSTTLNQELLMQGLNAHSFATLKSGITTNSCISKHLETNLSSVLGNYHLVNGYSYKGGDMHVTNESTFTATDLHSDADFSAMFNYTSSIGRIYGNYSGSIMKFTNFMDYHSTLSSYYQIVQSTTAVFSSVNGRVNGDHHCYISTKYDKILPNDMIQTQSYTTNQALPVSFVTNQNLYIPGQPLASDLAAAAVNPIGVGGMLYVPQSTDCMTVCCTVLTQLVNTWYNALPVNMVINTLQYRLGLINTRPNTFNILSSIAQLTSTGNMNYFMSINEEQNFNNMDIVMNENNAITNETTGQVKLMAAKILMGNVGDTGISQTLIQNPSLFENGLGKLDKLNIKVYNDDDSLTPAWLSLPFVIQLNEWDATFQIDEEIGFANQNSGFGNRPSIPVPEDPDDTPYIHFTHRNNPNNI